MPPAADQINYDLLYDKEYYSKYIHVNHFLDKELSYRIIDDCYIMPHNINNEGGLFSGGGSYISGSSFREGVGFTDEFKGNDGLILDLPDIESNKSTVVYLGLFLSVWGHFLTDTMRLLWFIQSRDYREKFYDCKLAYIPVQGFNLKGNHKRMLEILGIDCSMLMPVTELTRYDKVVLPDESFFMSDNGTRFFTSEYIRTIDSVRDYASEKFQDCKPRKVYYSYSGYINDKAVGEDKLERYFASKGYEIIHPEKLSLEEQLNLLINCGSFASTVGSCSHNILFLRDNTEVILIPRANYLTGYQVAIDQVHSQKINYIDSSFSIFTGKDPWSGPFLYFISGSLRRFFHDEDTQNIVSSSDFRKYLRISFGYSLSKLVVSADNPNVYRYYSAIASEYFSGLFNSSWLVRLKKRLKTIPALKNFFKKLMK